VSANAPCSILNSQSPLSGTAPTSNSWLVVIHQGPWGERPLDTLVSHDLTMWAYERGAKILLARTPKGVKPYPLSTFFYSSQDGELLIGTLNSQGIPDLALTHPYQPMLLICTNGKRDRCCAIFGRELISESKELLSPELFGQILECSHLGGHRFAPTAIWLPESLVLGRLTPHAVVGLLERGVMESQFIRGNSQLTPAQQVVHASVWPQRAEFESCDQVDSAYHIKAAVNGASEMFTVSTTTEHMVASCGAEPKFDTRYELTENV
jgi:hypothetical protein